MNSKKNHGIGLAVAILVSGLFLAIIAQQKDTLMSVFSNETECLAGCEITGKNGEIKFICEGDTGTCSKTLYGYTLTCSGREKKL